MISFLFFYFTLGVMLAAYLYLFEYEKPAPFVNEIYKALDGERSWHFKLREKLVIPGAILLITISWPVAIYMLIENCYKNRKNSEKKYEPQFTARIENV